MGAATFTEAADGQDTIGNRRVVRGTLALSASYATGGDSFDLATEVGLKEVTKILVQGSNAGYSVSLAGTTKVPLIKAWFGVGVELGATTDLSASPLTVELHGI